MTGERHLLAAIQRWLPSRAAGRGLPFVLAAAFVLIAVLPRNAPAAAVAAFSLAGLGCSALLPLTISFGQAKLAGNPAVVAGRVAVACSQAGYGLAAFGVGPLISAGVESACLRSSGPARPWLSPWAGCPWRSRTASRRPATVHPRPGHPRRGTGRARGTGEATASIAPLA